VDEETARLAKREAQVKLAIVLTQLAVLSWCLIPPHRRQLLLMRLAAGSGEFLGRAARSLGRACMGTELRTGIREYTLPLAASMARDRMAAAYERLRSS
jgi:hypothetical protein